MKKANSYGEPFFLFCSSLVFWCFDTVASNNLSVALIFPLSYSLQAFCKKIRSYLNRYVVFALYIRSRKQKHSSSNSFLSSFARILYVSHCRYAAARYRDFPFHSALTNIKAKTRETHTLQSHHFSTHWACGLRQRAHLIHLCVMLENSKAAPLSVRGRVRTKLKFQSVFIVYINK